MFRLSVVIPAERIKWTSLATSYTVMFLHPDFLKITMNNADDSKDGHLRDKHPSPPHKDWISDFPYTALLVLIKRQDVSPPLVIWITHFPSVMYV
ncbi:MAG: hypothetical protein AB1422_18940 [bacterium]